MSIHSNSELRTAAKLIYENKNCSVPFLFSSLKISYKEAIELINVLENKGVLGPYVENEERKIIIENLKELDQLIPEEVEPIEDEIEQFDSNTSDSIPPTLLSSKPSNNSNPSIDTVNESEAIPKEGKEEKNVVKINKKVSMFSSPFSFNGRIRRMEFGFSIIIFYVFIVIINGFSEEFPIMGLLVILAYWFLWAQAAKRCHDRGNSGWFQIIPFYVFWMLFADGEIGDNKYGPNPKGINLASKISDNNPSEQQESSSENLSKGEF